MAVSNKFQGQRGAGLIEILIASLVLSVLVVGGVRLNTVSQKQVAASVSQLQASKILASAIETGYFKPNIGSWQDETDQLQLARPGTQFSVALSIKDSQIFNESKSVSISYLSREEGSGYDVRALDGADFKDWSVSSVSDLSKVVAGIPL